MNTDELTEGNTYLYEGVMYVMYTHREQRQGLSWWYIFKSSTSVYSIPSKQVKLKINKI